jgi:hypothetical protein
MVYSSITQVFDLTDSNSDEMEVVDNLSRIDLDPYDSDYESPKPIDYKAVIDEIENDLSIFGGVRGSPLTMRDRRSLGVHRVLNDLESRNYTSYISSPQEIIDRLHRLYDAQREYISYLEAGGQSFAH